MRGEFDVDPVFESSNYLSNTVYVRGGADE